MHGRPAPHEPDNRELVIAWMGLEGQQRPVMVIDQGLMLYAVWKVSDLITHTLPPGHVASNGEWPVDSLRRMQIYIPAWYPAGSNPVESGAYNMRDLAQCFTMLLDSPSHRTHMLGEDACYRDQVRLGAAWARNTDKQPGGWAQVAVFVSAPAMG